MKSKQVRAAFARSFHYACAARFLLDDSNDVTRHHYSLSYSSTTLHVIYIYTSTYWLKVCLLFVPGRRCFVINWLDSVLAIVQSRACKRIAQSMTDTYYTYIHIYGVFYSSRTIYTSVMVLIWRSIDSLAIFKCSNNSSVHTKCYALRVIYLVCSYFVDYTDTSWTWNCYCCLYHRSMIGVRPAAVWLFPKRNFEWRTSNDSQDFSVFEVQQQVHSRHQ